MTNPPTDAELAQAYEQGYADKGKDCAEWQQAALSLGESMASSGPTGYYDFTPHQWLLWAHSIVLTLTTR